jgi:hypothetical protein
MSQSEVKFQLRRAPVIVVKLEIEKFRKKTLIQSSNFRLTNPISVFPVEYVTSLGIYENGIEGDWHLSEKRQ